MCEVEHPNAVNRRISSPDMLTRPDPPVVVTQHSQPPRKFVLLGAQVRNIIYATVTKTTPSG